jgi:hypothetical protein
MREIYVFFILLVFLFTILFFYPIVSNILANLDYNIRQIQEVSNSTEATGILSQIATMWKYAPILLILSIAVYAFYLLGKREPVEYGYEE